MLRRFAAIAVVFLFAMAVGGCQSILAGIGAGAEVPLPGSRAPDFTLPTPDGEQITLDQLRGKPVLINFWASWCGPCKMEMPDLQSAYQEHQQEGLVVLAVNVAEDSTTAANFAQELGLEFPIVVDQSGDVSLQYKVAGLPTSVFVDREGTIRALSIGAMNRDLIERDLEKIL